MGQIYSGTDFELTVETGIDITAMATKEILYRRPGSSTEGVFTSVSVIGTTQMRYNVPKVINGITIPAGRWMFHARVVDGTGKEHIGELATRFIRHKW
jgi:hypothetical protein